MIPLKPETEQLIQEEVKAGHFQSVDAFVREAVQALHAKLMKEKNNFPSRKSAIEEMKTFLGKNRVKLEGISIQDLIHEGHRV